jgi:hypothetical protein
MRIVLLATALALAACSSTPPPVIASFTASQTEIAAGGSTYLRFQVTGADKVQIDSDVGEVTGRTSAPVAPTSTTTFTITATNKGGSATAAVTVKVSPLAAQLLSFASDPGSTGSGKPVTLKWSASNAVSIKLSASPTPSTPLPQLRPTDTHVVVSPTTSTRYTLTVSGPPGTRQPVPLSATVLIAAVPNLVLTSDAQSVARGSTASLRWTSDIDASFTLVSTPHGGTATRTPLGPVTTTRVRPLADTDYAIEGFGPGGTGTSNSVTVTLTGAPASSLAYTAPTPTPADAVAMQLRSFDGAVATFDLVALKDISAGALALELPLDATTAGSRDGSARVALDGATAGDVAPGLAVNTAAINPGSAPASAMASLPADGPSAGVLLVGVAQKPACAGCSGGVGGDGAWTAGTVLASVRLRLIAAGGAGPVFDPSALDAAHGFRSTVRSAVTGAGLGTIAVGSLSAN